MAASWRATRKRGERFASFVLVIDDGTEISVPDRKNSEGSGSRCGGSFAQVTAYMGSVRIEPPLLEDRIEHTIKGRSVRASTRDPLPPVLVGGQVPVDQVPHEPTRSKAPVTLKILYQETRCDHAHTVVHPPFGEKLAHACVDERVSGSTHRPRPEALAGTCIGIPAQMVTKCLERLTSRLWPMPKDIGVELPPGQFHAHSVGSHACSESHQHRPGMDAPKAEIWRQSGRAGDPRVGRGLLCRRRAAP